MLANQVLQSVLSYMYDNKISHVQLVKVDLGELQGLEGTTLRMAYDTLSKGTPAEGSKLRVRRLKGIVSCTKCGYEGRLQNIKHEHAIDPAFHCPKCGVPVTIKSGRELQIREII